MARPSMRHWDREDGTYYRSGWRIESWTCGRRRFTVYYGTTEVGEFSTLREARDWAEAEARNRDAALAQRVSAELARWL